ncbi:MAG TPA: NAD(P)-binding domain-containing protein, partial [Elusimicrobiales bacterium]|nr:NAD(P)-binding domain-containing protein [Elusimicrobiales bacterium]
MLAPLAKEGFLVSDDNLLAARESDVLIMAVGPQQLEDMLRQLRPVLTSRHILVSIVSGVTTAQMRDWAGPKPKIIRSMTNTAIAIREAMTSLCAAKGSEDALPAAKELFDSLGCALVINEELMLSATALSGCGIAFFL